MGLHHHKAVKVMRSMNIRKSLSTSSKWPNISSKLAQNPHPAKPLKPPYIYSSERIPFACFSSFRNADNTRNALKLTGKILGGLLLGGVTLKLLKPSETVRAEGDEQRGQLKDDISGSESASEKKTIALHDAIKQSLDLVQRIKDETGSPGLTIAVSVGGETVWSQGLGYSDVENRLPCTPETVLRIASISKPITMTAVARLWERGDLDLDKPVQIYVPTFPEKYWNGEKVEVTTRQLLSHMAGIRGYDKAYMETANEKKDATDGNNQSATTVKVDESAKGKSDQSVSTVKNDQSAKGKSDKAVQSKSDDEMKEFYIRKNYTSVTESLSIFKDDPLVHKPGSQYLYTTHGWSLISAVVEGVAKTTFEKYMTKTFRDLGLDNTYLEYHEPLIYNRGRHYVKNKKGRLVNAPYVDLSYKWAGGGLISNVFDLLKFGNAMLYSYQATGCHGSTTSTKSKCTKENETCNKSNGLKQKDKDSEKLTKDKKDGKNLKVQSDNQSELNQCIPGYLKPETMRLIWSPVENAEPGWDDLKDGCYAMGWVVVQGKQKYGGCQATRYYLSHTGGAVGASSVLLILPSPGELNKGKPAKGVVVAIISNLNGVGLNEIALKIAKMFEVAELDS